MVKFVYKDVNVFIYSQICNDCTVSDGLQPGFHIAGFYSGGEYEKEKKKHCYEIGTRMS